MGTKFPLGVIKMFWNLTVGMVTQLCECTKGSGKQSLGPADLAHGQEPAQRLVGERRKLERPVPFHLELAPCRWTAASDESQLPWLGSNDKWVQLGNAEACRLHQSIRSRMKKPCWKESQNFF